MKWLSSTMEVVSAVLQVYMLLLVIRIVLTWISMDPNLPMVRVLGSVTDPYLNWFRRFKFLRWGNIDFSPVAAFIVVNFLANLAGMIGVYGEVTLGIILAIILRLVWGAASFFFALIGIASLVRLLAVRFRWGRYRAVVVRRCHAPAARLRAGPFAPPQGLRVVHDVAARPGPRQPRGLGSGRSAGGLRLAAAPNPSHLRPPCCWAN